MAGAHKLCSLNETLTHDLEPADVKMKKSEVLQSHICSVRQINGVTAMQQFV